MTEKQEIIKVMHQGSGSRPTGSFIVKKFSETKRGLKRNKKYDFWKMMGRENLVKIRKVRK